MTFDASRFTFHPWQDYLGVVMQQGRVQLDSDWNAWVAQLGRRLQAGSLDALGQAVVPRTTPDGFRIQADAGRLSIGVGRLYVDGLLAENHGGGTLRWDTRLAEPLGADPLDLLEQPYLPFNPSPVATGAAGVFDPPALGPGRHLAYVDVWQREINHLQDPELVEKAVGVDTTGRLQTVWQVKLLRDIGNAGCGSADDAIPGWSGLTKPSGGRLSTGTGGSSSAPDPCLAPPGAGFKGLDNQLYRLEIHRGGPLGTATFKWSRDNASVATRVLEIHADRRLVVDSLGRDDVLGFHGGDWIEVLDDWHELHGLPGRLHRIDPFGIDPDSGSITLEEALPAGLFPVDALNRTDPTRHLRIRRWDQSNPVLDASGNVHHDLSTSPVSDGIPVPAAGTRLSLEQGIVVDFSLVPGGEFRVGDHWLFAARTSDGSVEELHAAPPRGIHHHYARLAVVSLPDRVEDCRTLWPPAPGGDDCACTVCVRPETHNDGSATIQQAIDGVRARGGGTICLEAGTYRLRQSLDLRDVRSLRLRGQGWSTVLQSTQPGPALRISAAVGVEIDNLAILGAAAKGVGAMVEIENTADLQLAHLSIAAIGTADATAAAIGLSGVVVGARLRDCLLVAEQAVVGASGPSGYLYSVNLELIDNVLLSRSRGVQFGNSCLHGGLLRLRDNLIVVASEGSGLDLTGITLAKASLQVADNLIQVRGHGIVAGLDQLEITANVIQGRGENRAHGIVILSGGIPELPLRLRVNRNRISAFGGDGVRVEARLDGLDVKDNTITQAGGGGVVMAVAAEAGDLNIVANRFQDLGSDSQKEPCFAVMLHNSLRANVSDNHFETIARTAITNPLRGGLLAMGCEALRVANNHLQGIAPPQPFVGRGLGIGVAPGFRDLVIADNTIHRSASDTEDPEPAPWQALLSIGSGLRGLSRADTPRAVLATAGVRLLPLITPGAEGAGRLLQLSSSRIRVISHGGQAAVHGNRIRCRNSEAAACEVVDVESCRFDQNDIHLPMDKTSNLAGRIQAHDADLSHNRLAVEGRDISVDLVVDKDCFVVLGNRRTCPIRVNGTIDMDLPPPWNVLNPNLY